ncbi:MAG TPA: hypothetical protein DEB74_14940, partial [Lachnospiraceae bacterium]|nr:hypothetical protein [Lachnospiraceae bacterium]
FKCTKGIWNVHSVIEISNFQFICLKTESKTPQNAAGLIMRVRQQTETRNMMPVLNDFWDKKSFWHIYWLRQ